MCASAYVRARSYIYIYIYIYIHTCVYQASHSLVGGLDTQKTRNAWSQESISTLAEEIASLEAGIKALDKDVAEAICMYIYIYIYMYTHTYSYNISVKMSYYSTSYHIMS